MNTQTSLAAEQIRLQQWAYQIMDCQNRLSGMKVDVWCREHGITKANYYYRLCRLREACLEFCDSSPPFVELTASTEGIPFKVSQTHSPVAAALRNGTSQKSYRSSQLCLMMLPDFKKYILPPVTRICAEVWKDWKTSFASVSLWIPMAEIPCFCSAAREQTVSRDSCGRKTDSCYYTNGWIPELLTDRETTKKHCRSLWISTQCSCKDWRLLPDTL